MHNDVEYVIMVEYAAYIFPVCGTTGYVFFAVSTIIPTHQNNSKLSFLCTCTYRLYYDFTHLHCLWFSSSFHDEINKHCGQNLLENRECVINEFRTGD